MNEANGSQNPHAVSSTPNETKPAEDWPIEDFDFEFDEDFEPEQDERW